MKKYIKEREARACQINRIIRAFSADYNLLYRYTFLIFAAKYFRVCFHVRGLTSTVGKQPLGRCSNNTAVRRETEYIR